MAVSEARKRANVKWEKANYKQINFKIPIKDFEKIDNFCKERNLSKNGFIKESALMRIDSIESEKEKEKEK